MLDNPQNRDYTSGVHNENVLSQGGQHSVDLNSGDFNQRYSLNRSSNQGVLFLKENPMSITGYEG